MDDEIIIPAGDRASAIARRRLLLCVALAGAGFVLCSSASAQGFPGGGGGMPGGGGGMHGGHGAPPAGAMHQAPPQGGRQPEPLEELLRTAHDLRQSLMLDATQTQHWADMQADLRDALDKRKSLMIKPTDAAQVPNPPLLFVQDMAAAESALGSALDKLSKSMQAAFDALDERQRRIFVERMTSALRPDASP